MIFDPGYLARWAEEHGWSPTSDANPRCALPFTMTGAPELISLGYEAGFEEKNAGGFGMVELI
jgi:hypothetical protein